MKKLMFAVGLALITSSLVGAACTGPFCYDDTGASIGGLLVDGNGLTIPVLSSTTLNAVTPKATGQTALCNSCVNNPAGSNKMALCISTAAVVGSYVMASSGAVVCK